MGLYSDLPAGVESRKFPYRASQFESWVAAHGRWWPDRSDPSVWGPFAAQAASGRYTFSSVNQPRLHFAETFVAWHLEQEGYVCWTRARILRNPGTTQHGQRARQTKLVEALCRETIGLVPQVAYTKRYMAEGLRLKNPDVVGFHFGRHHWVFSEVKKPHTRDRLHPGQVAGLSFLRKLFPIDVADIFVALAPVTAEDHPQSAG